MTLTHMDALLVFLVEEGIEFMRNLAERQHDEEFSLLYVVPWPMS